MSRRYKGAIISATPPTTTGGESGTAPGEWTLQQQMQAQGGSVWPSQPLPKYIEDVFSTYLYTGTSQPGNSSAYGYLVNNIDLLTKGGMIWTKDRSNNATGTNDNVIVDTLRGTGTWPAGISNSPYMLKTNTTAAQVTMSDAIQGVTTTGYYIGPGNTGVDAINTLNNNYVSWTFREQPKFFDVVTYTGNGSNPRAISHLLGSTPGCMIVKRTDTTGNWFVYHRSSAASGFTAAQCYMYLNLTNAVTDNSTIWSDTAPTSTTFTVGSSLNTNGATYVAYLFAHDAGGFGLTGTDNVISCGSFTSSGSGTASITLGYEPQWVMIKCTTTSDSWYITDTMRGMPAGPATTSPYLVPNTSAAEASWGNVNGVNATGWSTAGLPASQTFIYIAIRRGPMALPTTGTQVYSGVLRTGTGSAANVTGAGFPPDLVISEDRIDPKGDFSDRLRGTTQLLKSYETSAESTDANSITSFSMDGMAVGTGFTANRSGRTYVYWFLRRYPSVFDEVCYTGTGSARTINHNLTVAPEMYIVKTRSTGGTNRGWWTYVAPLGNAQGLYLNDNSNAQGAGIWNTTNPTSTVFSVDGSYLVNESGTTYVAYLFATCAGVSKVGSYTGTGATQTINCGFTGGARWVMVKRTDSTGDWYVWDTARGMVSGTDPSLLLNSNTGEVNANSVYTITTGFQIVSTAAGINASGGTYIFLAIA